MLHFVSLVMVLSSATAVAATSDELAAVDDQAVALLNEASGFDQRLQPGELRFDQSNAELRFEEYLYLRLIGRNREAAEGFFGLVTTGALSDPVLHRDAEWHLAEALYGMGNTVTAEARFRAIASDSSHPFREEAVLRLLDLYSETGQAVKFYDLYEAEVALGKVPPTAAITYTVAKSFYRNRDFAKAAEYFQKLESGTEEYLKARYFLGVIRLLDGDIDGSVGFFDEVVQATDAAAEQQGVTRQVRDLALLAQGRIAYEKGEFDKAAVFYQDVGGDSDYLADVLFETSWNFIKQGRFDEALDRVSLFLLAFPQHRYSGELRVVEGHLHMGCAQDATKCPNTTLVLENGDPYEIALETYEGIARDYVPIRDRFKELASSDEIAASYVNKLDSEDGLTNDVGVPNFALAMMRQDPELSDAIGIFDTLETQLKDVSTSESIIDELQAILSGESSFAGFESIRHSTVKARAQIQAERLNLLSIEAEWLGSHGTDSARVASVQQKITELQARLEGRVQGLDERQSAFENRITEIRSLISDVERSAGGAADTLAALRRDLAADNSVEGADQIREHIATEASSLSDARIRLGQLHVELSQLQMPSHTSEVDEDGVEIASQAGAIRATLRSLRGSGSGESRQIDEIDSKLQRADDLFVVVLGKLESLADSEIGRIREQFETEVTEVAAQRSDLDRTEHNTKRVVVKLTRGGFQKMEEFFSNAVVKADLGIIDVYWARKLEIADKRESLQDDRNAVVSDLERRFELIRLKMEQ